MEKSEVRSVTFIQARADLYIFVYTSTYMKTLHYYKKNE